MQIQREPGDGGAQAPSSLVSNLQQTHAFLLDGQTVIVGFDLLGAPAGLVWHVGGRWRATRPGLLVANFGGLRCLRGETAGLDGMVAAPVVKIVAGADMYLAVTRSEPMVATVGVSTWSDDLLGIAPGGWDTMVDPALGVLR